MREGFFSFVSQYPIPFVYGLTPGEVAIMINEEGMNRGQKGNLDPVKCKLKVVPMRGWHRWMLYEDTGLPWVLPSPNIPSPRSALCYPASGIAGEFGHLQIGVGYTIPFEVFAAEWIDADALKARLDSYHIPGTAFRTMHYKPLAGSKQGKLVHGVQFFFTDWELAPVTLVQFYVMQAVNELYPDHNPLPLKSTRMLDIISGTDYVRTGFGERFQVSDILDFWTRDVKDFKALSAKYYLYF